MVHAQLPCPFSPWVSGQQPAAGLRSKVGVGNAPGEARIALARAHGHRIRHTCWRAQASPPKQQQRVLWMSARRASAVLCNMEVARQARR